ncbi:MAG: hypothetical protein H7X93_14415 [Sphingomonadaceae bacterium]|nr:hypothetical protein [Sphingomonadaceae bacterium]
MALFGALTLPTAAFGQAETSTFTYDALGRVTEAESVRTGGTITNAYQYDDADNRISDTVTQSGSLAPDPEEPAPAADPLDEPES